MRLALFVCAAALAITPAAAQERDFSKVEIKVEQLAPGVAVLFGAGGNIGLSYGEDGNILIDDQYAPLTEKIVAAVRSLDPDPIKFVINTHWHGDHTGGNENLGSAGAVIMAHDNVRMRMASEQVLRLGSVSEKVSASPRGALPVLTFADGVTVHLNGDTLQVIHVANAHTDGDSLIRWEKADVLHMGDVYFNRISFPFIDLSSGGSIDGAIAAVNRGLELARDSTKIIPGHGPVATRVELVAYRDMLADIRAKVAAGIASGLTLDQIKASKPAERYGMPDGFVKPDAFVETVYTSLKSPPAPHAH